MRLILVAQCKNALTIAGSGVPTHSYPGQIFLRNVL